MKDPSYLNQTYSPLTRDRPHPTNSNSDTGQPYNLKAEWKESNKWIKFFFSMLLIGGFAIMLAIGLADSRKKIQKASDDFDKNRTEQKAKSLVETDP